MADDVLRAPHVLEYPYLRSVGPVIGAFLTALRDGRILGARSRAADGSATVVVPPTEYDPISGADTGELVADLAGKKEYCGLFRTPSLRNVALRRVFFHNGVFHRLDDVVRFYGERDSQPQKWYPRAANGAAHKFDDLPAAYQGNVDRIAPFDRHMGDPPSLSEGDVADIVAFLNTLTDGYRPEPSNR